MVWGTGDLGPVGMPVELWSLSKGGLVWHPAARGVLFSMSNYGAGPSHSPADSGVYSL